MSGLGYAFPYNTPGGGGTNPTSLFMPVNIGGTFQDSIFSQPSPAIVQATNGLKLNTGSDVYQFGGWNGNAWQLRAEADNFFTASRAGNMEGLLFVLGVGTRAYYAGDYEGASIGVSTKIDSQGFKTGTDLHTAGAKEAGLWVQPYNTAFASLGDFAFNYNGTSLTVNDHEQFILSGFKGKAGGLYMTNSGYTNPLVQLGDYFNNWNGPLFEVDADQKLIRTTYGGGVEYGLRVDFSNIMTLLGDDINNFSIDGILQQFSTTVAGNRYGLQIISGLTTIGDFDGISLGTKAEILDSNFRIVNQSQVNGLALDFGNQEYSLGELSTTYLKINGASQAFELSSNLLSGTAGGNSGQYLKVYIGGTEYKIQLLDT